MRHARYTILISTRWRWGLALAEVLDRTSATGTNEQLASVLHECCFRYDKSCTIVDAASSQSTVISYQHRVHQEYNDISNKPIQDQTFNLPNYIYNCTTSNSNIALWVCLGQIYIYPSYYTLSDSIKHKKKKNILINLREKSLI